MFRQMRRIRQQLSPERVEEILARGSAGTLAVLGDEGYPYAVPLSYVYHGGRLYFHCAKAGHKLDAIRACDKVSFCVMDEGFRKEGEWALNITSVVVFGRIRFVTDPELITKIGTNLCRKFTNDEEYIRHEVEFALPRAQCLELIPEHMTGKLVNES